MVHDEIARKHGKHILKLMPTGEMLLGFDLGKVSEDEAHEVLNEVLAAGYALKEMGRAVHLKAVVTPLEAVTPPSTSSEVC